jgi:predicted membrane-bound spermidine synthase
MWSSVVCALFFASGASALLFETLWFRQAGLVFGNSVWASTLVLSSFMAVLALGNGLAARFGGRARGPIRIYGLLELIVAGTGVALVLLLPLLTDLLAPLFRPFIDTPWIINPLRLGISFGLLAIPATAMGATLPILVRALSAADPNFAHVLGRLYGWNTLGAVAGAWAGEAFLIARLGITGTGLTAGALNTGAALAALALAPRIERQAAGAPPEEAARREPLRRSPAALRLMAAAFLSGAILLGLEVVWFRFLSLFVYGTSVAFAVMLAIVLAGIALGGLAASRAFRRNPELQRWLPHLALLSGALVMALYAGFGGMARALFGPAAQPSLHVARPIEVLALGAPLMFLPSFLSGALFTAMGQAARRELAADTRTAGMLTLSNTAGGVAGSLLAGFLMLPLLGAERTLWLLALSYAGVAALTLPSRLGASLRASPAALPAATALFLLVSVTFPHGRMRDEYILEPARPWLENGMQVVGVREGLTETLIYVRRSSLGQPLDHRMLTNGYSMATNSTVAQRYMKLFVYWPIAFHPDPKDALLISFGMGSTADALVQTRHLERIDVVDISRDALEMSRMLFPPPRMSPLDDPRVRVHVEDGRFFLQTTGRRFDVITAEPPPPKNAGVGNLYSREYFSLVRERLNEGGIVSYWLPCHLLGEADTKAIIRGFCDVFDDCSLWNANALDWMLVGSRSAAGRVPEARIRRQWDDPVVGPQLRALGFEAPEQLAALYLGDASDLATLTAGTAPLVDDHPHRLSPEFTEPADHAGFYMDVAETRGARERLERSRLMAETWPPALLQRSLPYFEWQAILNKQLDDRGVSILDDPTTDTDLVRVLLESELETLAVWLLNSSDAEIRIAERQAAQGRRSPGISRQLGIRALSRRNWAVAVQHFDRVLEAHPRFARIRQLRGFAACMAEPDATESGTCWPAAGAPGE